MKKDDRLDANEIVNMRWDADDNLLKSRRKNGKKQASFSSKKKPQNVDGYCEICSGDRLSDSKEIVQSALQHFNGNVDAVAAALEIPAVVVDKIDSEEKAGFTEDVLKKSGRLFRNRVTKSDPLTGLLNRGAFILETTKLIKKKAAFYGDVY